MVADSVHTNGFLGWVQGTGKQPSDGQPLRRQVPNFEDFGLGCFLLAGADRAPRGAVVSSSKVAVSVNNVVVGTRRT